MDPDGLLHIPSKGVEYVGDKAQPERRWRLLPVDPPVGVIRSIGIQRHLVRDLLVGAAVLPPAKEGEHGMMDVSSRVKGLTGVEQTSSFQLEKSGKCWTGPRDVLVITLASLDAIEDFCAAWRLWMRRCASGDARRGRSSPVHQSLPRYYENRGGGECGLFCPMINRPQATNACIFGACDLLLFSPSGAFWREFLRFVKLFLFQGSVFIEGLLILCSP